MRVGLPALLKKAPLVGAFFMAVIWQMPALALCPTPDRLAMVGVRNVVDGDTLRLVDGRSVRLIGINAPELARRGTPGEPLAEAARRRLAALVRESGGVVGLRPGREPRDKYGRTLAQVYARSGDNLAARLLSEGLGFRVAVAPNVSQVACQRQAEKAARKAGRGIWRDAPVQKASTLRRSGFALVGGKVSDVRRNRQGIRIEMDDSLVVQVPAHLLRSFPSSFTSGLKGRHLEVRGWVLDRSRSARMKRGEKRWLLPLTDASMLEWIGS